MRKVTHRGTLKTGMVAVLLVVLMAIGSGSGLAYLRPGRTERVSLASDGTQGSMMSERPRMTPDGRYVVFESMASNLVPGDTNEAWDIFVHDRVERTTERVSVAGDGSQGENPDYWPPAAQATISDDGRYVAFMSWATNLAPNETNWDQDVFVHDRQTGETELISAAPDGTGGNRAALDPYISPDGRYVAFYSLASNLVSGDTNELNDIFIHDRETGTNERISLAHDGVQSNGHSYGVEMSADLRYVVFESHASNLVPGDTNGALDVFVRDRVENTITRVSVASDGSQASSRSWHASITDDGQHIAFYSQATNLVPRDTNLVGDAFVHDLESRKTERVSVGTDGAEAKGCGDSGPFSISADGRYVAFYSFARNIIPGGTNRWSGLCVADGFVHDRLTRTTERIALASDGTEGNFGGGVETSLSADGRYIAFPSISSNLVPGDTQTCGNSVSCKDIFVRDRGPALGVAGLEASEAGNHVSVSGWATFSPTVISTSQDAANDGSAGASPVGGELTGASVSHRPEDESLLVRLELDRFPGSRPAQVCLPGAAVCPVGLASEGGLPAVVHGIEFQVGGTRYEARTFRGVGTDAPNPRFALYTCAVECTETARVTGGYGTTGEEVVIALPVSAISTEGNPTLTGLRAFTGIGDTEGEGLHALDAVTLPDATVPASRVELGMAPRGTPETDVMFDSTVSLSNGFISEVIDVSARPKGEYDVWARACLGETCAARSVGFTKSSP